MVALVAAVLLMAANVSNYDEQGGARTVIGGSIDVVSGGDMDIESGGALKIAGTQVTSSASELNALDADSMDDDGGVGMTRVVRSEFDATVDGGTSGASYELGESLPANAIAVRNWFQVITQFVDDASGTVAIKCGSNTLFTAADITGSAAGTITSGALTGSSVTAAFDASASGCDLSVDLGPATVSAGKLVHWVEYVISE